MAKEIKQKIVLEGEKEYKQALKDAQRNLKTLQSALKAETAEMGKNATAQEKNAAKTENLKKQIAEQEKVVKTLREALDKAKEQYGDNADVVQKWEQQLNAARTTLANMKNDLDDVGAGMQNIETSAAAATVATKSVADSFDRLGSIGDTIASGIETAFEGLIGTVKEAIGYVWGEITDLAARSNDLVDMAGYWNTDVITLQKYKGAVESASGSFEDLNGIVNKINLLDDKKVASLTQVSKVNYKDEWKYAMAVMDSLNQMDLDERNSIAEQMFGKGNQAAKDLLNDWDQIQEKLIDFDAENGGFGLTEEQLNDMSTLYDQINEMHTKWASLKDMVMQGLFGQLSLDLTGNAINILDAIKDYMNAEPGSPEEKAALDKIEQNIDQMFDAIEDALQRGIDKLNALAEKLKDSDNPAAQTIGNVIAALVEGLEWLGSGGIENTVIPALETLATFWLVGKGAQMAATILSIVNHINTIKGFSSTGAVSGIGAVVGKTLKYGGPVLAGLYTLFENALVPQGNDDILDENGNVREEMKKLGYSVDENGNISGPENRSVDVLDLLGARKHIEEYEDLDEGKYTQADRDAAIQDWWDAYKEAVESGDWTEQNDAIDWIAEVFGDGWEGIFDALLEKVEGLNGETPDDLPASWWQTTGGNSGDGDTITSSDLQSFRNTPAAMEKAVRNGVKGIRVTLDGRTVGNLVAPYVSQYIAETIM